MDYEKKYKEALEKAKNYHSPETVCNVRIAMENLFPELKESDDERIRKALRERIIRYDPNNEILIKEEGISQRQFIAWLEKQVKKDEEILVLKDQIESLRAAREALKEVHKIELEKQGEQKPAWSEKDTEMLNVAMQSCEQCGNEYAYYWLKSLKERVQPQPKQEWSEEDKNNILFLTSIIEECFKDKEKITLYGDTVCANFTKEDVIDRLKSLSPQKQWKPTEEQIKALAWALSLAKSCGEECSFDLRTLHEQLKKLREE